MCVWNKHGPKQILPPSTFQNMLKQKIILVALKHCNDLGCLSNDKDNKDDDSNDNVKKQLVLLARQQLCHASCFLVYFFDVHCTTMT